MSDVRDDVSTDSGRVSE